MPSRRSDEAPLPVAWRDKHGHLRDATAWTPQIFAALCAMEQIEPTPTRLRLAQTIRAFYDRYHTEPTQRTLTRFLQRELPDLALDSVVLLALLPGGMLRQGTRIAGMPLPRSCFAQAVPPHP